MADLAYSITSGDDGLPVRRIALSRMGMSYGLLKRAKFEGKILLDGVQVHADVRVRAGQQLLVCLPQATPPPIAPCAASLVVPYQDEHLLVVDKPAPLASSSSYRKTPPTLENVVFSHLGCPEGFVYRPVNRLDKGTSGLMVVALHAHAQHRLQRMLHTEGFLREYVAVCDGFLPQAEGIVCQPIAKADGATVKREVSSAGKQAVTHYRELERGACRSLVQLRLGTGRTHQIRVHMQWLGCPVMGDFLYGEEVPSLPRRFALHSHRVCFVHPITGKTIDVKSPLPQELSLLIAQDSAGA